MILERVELQERAKPRKPGELGAHEFQLWLGKWKGRADVTVKVAIDGSHAIAETVEAAA